MTVKELDKRNIPCYPDNDGGLWYWTEQGAETVEENDMGYTWDNDCVSCERCSNCGRGDFKAYYCDDCDEYTDELYVYEKYELCWDCYKKKFVSKICDDMDDTRCTGCGNEAEELFCIDGEWMCEDCLNERAERVNTDDM